MDKSGKRTTSPSSDTDLLDRSASKTELKAIAHARIDRCHSLKQEIQEEDQIWRQRTFGLGQVETEVSVGWAGRYECGYEEKGKEYGTESHHH